MAGKCTERMWAPLNSGAGEDWQEETGESLSGDLDRLRHTPDDKGLTARTKMYDFVPPAKV